MTTDGGGPAEEQAADLEALLAFIKESRGVDFTGYKRGSLTRRIRKRMAEVGYETYAAYRDELERTPGEFTELFNTVLINVTGFLRDADAWEYLADTILPAILAAKGEEEPIRLWSAGCASGQEAYSLAVLLCDIAGEGRFRRTVKIYATDVDEEALTAARHGVYPSKQVDAAFTSDQVDRYFEKSSDGSGRGFRTDLRRALIFGRHDLVQDPPISRVDLLVCRNTLMYFTADTQRRILASFHFALNATGFLFLGKSEALTTRSDLFGVEDLRFHVFTKRSDARPRPSRAAAAALTPAGDGGASLVEAAIEASPVAQIVVDARQNVVAANRHARSMFGIASDHVGRAFKELTVSYRPVELRSIIEEVRREGRAVTVPDVEFESGAGRVEYLEIHVAPIGDPQAGGTSIAFTQMGRFRALREELERSQRELETAYEELQSTVEELETTNEELQSTNEELETTNEELQSTNEELETMNEELQSTNEELETINHELEQRSAELDQVNFFLESILGSLAFGVAVLDLQMGVRFWNREAEDLWGLRASEVQGQHFLNLDIGLPVDQLRSAVRRCFGGESDGERLTLDAVNRRGRQLRCDVTILPQQADRVVVGAIVLMQAAQGAGPI